MSQKQGDTYMLNMQPRRRRPEIGFCILITTATAERDNKLEATLSVCLSLFHARATPSSTRSKWPAYNFPGTGELK